MAKFFGKVGYTSTVEMTDGVWVEDITEVEYYGDVIRNERRLEEDEKVNSDISVRHTISVVADAYAGEHFSAIRYVEWAGVKWRVTSVEVLGPRLQLRLGGVYNAEPV